MMARLSSIFTTITFLAMLICIAHSAPTPSHISRYITTPAAYNSFSNTTYYSCLPVNTKALRQGIDLRPSTFNPSTNLRLTARLFDSTYNTDPSNKPKTIGTETIGTETIGTETIGTETNAGTDAVTEKVAGAVTNIDWGEWTQTVAWGLNIYCFASALLLIWLWSVGWIDGRLAPTRRVLGLRGVGRGGMGRREWSYWVVPRPNVQRDVRWDGRARRDETVEVELRRLGMI